MAGFYPGAPTRGEAEEKLKALLGSGVRCIVNLVEEDEGNYATGQRLHPYQQLLYSVAAEKQLDTCYVRMPIRDQGIPSVPAMQGIIDLIDSALIREQTTYVHCWGGKGRTGTVIGCYLARHGIAVGEEALQRIQWLRRNDPTAHESSPENSLQCEMVRQWKQGE